MFKKYRKRLVYFIPIYGTLQLIKRVEKIERFARKENEMKGLGFQYYEARIESIYGAIMERMKKNDPVYFAGKIEDLPFEKANKSGEA